MTPTRKLVLQALARHADQSGLCWPSVTTISRLSGLSVRAIQGALSWLESAKAIRQEFRKGQSTHYWITPALYQPPQQVHPRTRCTTPRQQVHHTPAAGAGRSIQGTTKEHFQKGAEAPDSPKAFIFREGVKALQAQGIKEADARSILAKVAKHRGDSMTAQDLKQAQALGVVDLRSWLFGLLKGPGKRQAADVGLEAKDYSAGLPVREVAA